MNHRWQSEPTDGPKVGEVAFFGVVAMVAMVAMFAVVTSPTTAGCSVVERSCSCSSGVV